MRKIDYVSEIIKCCQKREEVLLKGQSIKIYNRYFDKMRKLARQLFNENRQDELLPYLASDSISIQKDIAGLLFNWYPELCTITLERIANMTIPTGLPKHLAIVAGAAYSILKHGIPKDYP